MFITGPTQIFANMLLAEKWCEVQIKAKKGGEGELGKEYWKKSLEKSILEGKYFYLELKSWRE